MSGQPWRSRYRATAGWQGPPPQGLHRTTASVQMIRTRIARHEPILNWNLCKRYGDIVAMTEWLSPPAAAWCRAH